MSEQGWPPTLQQCMDTWRMGPDQEALARKWYDRLLTETRFVKAFEMGQHLEDGVPGSIVVLSTPEHLKNTREGFAFAEAWLATGRSDRKLHWNSNEFKYF